METKLAGLFAFLGFAVLVSTWLVRSIANLSPMPVEKLVTFGCFVFWVYFFLGWGIAKLGVSLVQEVLAEKRLREEERRIQARGIYAGGESAAEGEEQYSASEGDEANA